MRPTDAKPKPGSRTDR